MKTLKLNFPEALLSSPLLKNILLSIILLLSWFTLPGLLRQAEPGAGLLDAGIWQLLLLSLICFATILSGAWWLLYRLWHEIGLTDFAQMVSQFNRLTLWQRLRIYWASFALLLLAAVACLAAIF